MFNDAERTDLLVLELRSDLVRCLRSGITTKIFTIRASVQP